MPACAQYIPYSKHKSARTARDPGAREGLDGLARAALRMTGRDRFTSRTSDPSAPISAGKTRAMPDDQPRHLDLLTENPVYKPFRYPWAYEAWLTQQRCHWLPEEVPLAEDVKDSEPHRGRAQPAHPIFRFFTQADVEVNNCYMKHYAGCSNPSRCR